jgi:hypothetical protein
MTKKLVDIIYYTNEDLSEADIATRFKEIQDIMWEHQCEVTFTKVNGDTRVMSCTLMKDALPQRDANTLHETRLHDSNCLNVWSLDSCDWRSFRTANVTRIKILS